MREVIQTYCSEHDIPVFQSTLLVREVTLSEKKTNAVSIHTPPTWEVTANVPIFIVRNMIIL